MKMINPHYEDEVADVSVDLDVVVDTAEDAAEVAESVGEADVMTVEADVADATVEAVEAYRALLVADGCQSQYVYNLGVALGLTDFGQSKGLSMPGVESLSFGSRNENVAQQLIASCDAGLEAWYDGIVAFFKKVKAWIVSLAQRVMDFFRSQAAIVNRLEKLLKDKNPADKEVNDAVGDKKLNFLATGTLKEGAAAAAKAINVNKFQLSESELETKMKTLKDVKMEERKIIGEGSLLGGSGYTAALTSALTEVKEIISSAARYDALKKNIGAAEADAMSKAKAAKGSEGASDAKKALSDIQKGVNRGMKYTSAVVKASNAVVGTWIKCARAVLGAKEAKKEEATA